MSENLQIEDSQSEIQDSSQQIVEEIIEQLSQPGVQVFYLDGQEITSKETFLKKVAAAMHFPETLDGHSWDSFEQGITDLTWFPAEGYILFYDRADIFAQTAPKQWQIALKILRSALEYWGKTDTPLDIFLLYGNGIYQLSIEV